jgi:hypothetical protein
MWRIAVGRLSKSFEKSSRATDGARHVARLFVPGYGHGIAINVTLSPDVFQNSCPAIDR